MLLVYDSASIPISARVILDHKDCKISCSTVLGLCVFNSQNVDITRIAMGQEHVEPTAANIALAVQAIDESKHLLKAKVKKKSTYKKFVPPTWKEAIILIPRTRSASLDTMQSMKLKDRSSIFEQAAAGWRANVSHPTIQSGQNLAVAFVEANGGSINHCFIAAFSLAADADGVRYMSYELATELTANYEDAKKKKHQAKLLSSYPTIRAVTNHLC